jgi:hypothetical protein
MTDWGKSGRVDTYRAVLVNPFTLEEAGDIDIDLESTSITYGYYTDNIVQANIAVVHTGVSETGEANNGNILDGINHMIRIYHTCVVDDYGDETCLGTFFVDSCSSSAENRYITRSMSCYSALWRMTQDILLYDFNRSTGYNVVQEIQEIIKADYCGYFNDENVFGTSLLLVKNGVDTTRKHTRDISFEAGTTRSEVLNTIAGWIDCEIGVDPYGYITIGPYLAPGDKTISYTFKEGEGCVYLASYTYEEQAEDPINRVKVCYSREERSKLTNDDGSYQTDSSGNYIYDSYPLSDYVVVELPEDYAFSYARTGRVKSEILTLDDPIDHSEMETKAWTYLYENCGSTTYMTFQHVGIPDLEVGQVVRYINYSDGSSSLDVKGLITEMSIDSLTPGCTTKTTIKLLS